MKKSIIAAAIALACLPPVSATAGSYSEALGNCLVRSTTDADRTQLMRWVVVAYAHAEGAADLVTAQPDALDQMSPIVADLLVRLLAEDCNPEAVSAINNEGTAGFQLAFQTLGIVAGREAFQDPGVQAAVSDFTRYIDNEKLSAALGK